MSRSNPARRDRLTDAAVTLLAREGARGLTYRALDTFAEVPIGTASNYFSSRDALIEAAGRRIIQRLWPDPELLPAAAAVPPSRARLAELLVESVDRALADPELHLALLELRLEATRNPAIAATLTATMRDNLAANQAFLVEAGLPGDPFAIIGLYLALTGLLVDRLTLPDALPDLDTRAFVLGLVERLVV